MTQSNPFQTPPVAIIGMGCIFPQSPDLKGYWRLLLQGKDAIGDIPDTHWSPEDYFDPDPKKPDHVYCKRGGFIPQVSFDPSEFGIPPSSLEATDTAQLLGLVAAKAALKDAGYDVESEFDRDRVSVVLGVTGTQELVIPLGARLGHPKWRRALAEAGVDSAVAEDVVQRIADSYVPWQENSFPGLLGNVVAGRICNRLNLGGTNCVVDAACASSMSAIHLSLMELFTGRADMAVTGGVDLLNDIFMHTCFSKTQILSSTGDARPFSADADGTVLGEGVGLLVLKPLSTAESDGDRIYAVIKGMGSSSDGKSQSIYAPRAEGQARALKTAYKSADIDPATVSLVEAHGTGTRVGDAVEIKGLTSVFGQGNGNKRCAVGSVKSMIGHTKAAAGSAGLIKTVLALHHKVILPTLKADRTDPKLDLENTPFYIATRRRPWINESDTPRRAGVSAFGFGGSNFHIVLEEYDRHKTAPAWDGSVEIMAFSGNDPADIQSKLDDLTTRLSNLDHRAIALEAHDSRRLFNLSHPHRLLIVLDETQDANGGMTQQLRTTLQKIQTNDAVHIAWSSLPDNVFYGGPNPPGKLAYVFPGQGSQYVDMGRDLACLFPEFLDAVERFSASFDGKGCLSDRMFPPPAQDKTEKKRQEDALRQTDAVQPAIGAISLGMFRVLSGFGLSPDAVCGHSYGELPALHAAGRINVDDLIRLSVLRGRLMAEASRKSEGAMTAIKSQPPQSGIGIQPEVSTSGLDVIQETLKSANLNLVLANRNSPEQGVVSGKTADIELLESLCKEKGLRFTRLPVSAAFHSPLMDKVREPFAQALLDIPFSSGLIPVYANALCAPYPDDAESARKILADQIISPVDFIGQIQSMYDAGIRTFLEVGPKSVLSSLIAAILPDKDVWTIPLDPSAGRRFGLADMARGLCRLAALGHSVRIDQWESRPEELPKQRMTIPLSGANYRSNTPRKPAQSKPDAVQQQQTQTARPKSSNSVPTQFQNSTKTMPKSNQRTQRPSSAAAEALQVVREGLQSMQALQTQTARTHEKFLEAQTQASRTLQEMMQSTRRLAEAAMGAGMDVSASKYLESQAPLPPEPKQQDPEPAPKPSKSAAPPPTPSVQPMPKPEQPGPSNATLETALLEVVSELTGYPAEMLSMDMDIEADLGIDSIKRVEILSAMEERLPDLPQVSPEIMGTLRTLGEVAAQLTEAPAESRDAMHSVSASTSPTTKGSSAETAQSVQPAQDGRLEETLLTVVSELTGYPTEMLSMDMDIEADLGIDSIKRVEILSAMEERLPDFPAVSPEIMGTLRTLGEIASYMSCGPEGQTTDAEPPEAQPKTDAALKKPEAAPSPTRANDPTVGNVQRRIVAIRDVPKPDGPALTLPAGRAVLITGDKAGLADVLARALTDRYGLATCVIPHKMEDIPDDLPAVGGLILLAQAWEENKSTLAKDAFLLGQRFGSDLLASAADGGAIFASVSSLDGGFGFRGGDIQNPQQGALAGLVKTAALEWPEVRCRAIDLPPDWTDMEAVAKELAAFGPVETGLDRGRRFELALEASPYPQGAIHLTPGDVVVMTGGGRGVTAWTAYPLATYLQPTLVLLGRSPAPEPDPDWLLPLEDPAEIKKAILTYDFRGHRPTPAQLEDAFQRHKASREIQNSLLMLEAAGSVVRYFQADVRDPAAVESVLDQVRSEYGPVKALVHGAGTLKDRRILDKSPEDFSTVFDTKVKGLENLLTATSKDPLQYLILFSSVSARLGNRGQADYAMANEVLNKMARQEAARKPDCRTISINWGPWDGGMVKDAVKREFQRNGIALIPAEAGAMCMLQEMMGRDDHPVEVLIGAGFDDAAPPQPDPDPPLSLSFKREIDLARHPILGDHVIDGHPVVPFALMTEWLSHGALHEHPGMVLYGLDDIRLLSGIKLNSAPKLIRLMAGKAQKKNGRFEVPVEIRDGVRDGADVIHSRARAILASQPAPPPDDVPDPDRFSSNDLPPIDEVYEKVLFHGAALRGIKRIRGISQAGMAADLAAAPSPDQWMANPHRSRWVADPLALDAAFQMAIVWCHHQKGMLSLPSYSAAYRQYCRRFPRGGVTAVLEVREATDRKMTGDISFLDDQCKIVARLKGYEAIMDPLLFRAFGAG